MSVDPNPTPSPNPAPAAGAEGGEPSPSPATTPNRPEGLDDRFWDPANGVKLAELLGEHKSLAEFKATVDAKAATVPATPEDYELGLPEGFELPQGVEFAFDQNDPVMGSVLAEARTWAHANGLAPDAVKGLLGLYAKSVLTEDSAMRAASEASLKKLGANGAGRVDAVHRFLDAKVGEGRSQHLKAMLVTAEQVEAFETLMRSLSSQGAAAPGGRLGGDAPAEPVPLAKRLFPSMN